MADIDVIAYKVLKIYSDKHIFLARSVRERELGHHAVSYRLGLNEFESPVFSYRVTATKMMEEMLSCSGKNRIYRVQIDPKDIIRDPMILFLKDVGMMYNYELHAFWRNQQPNGKRFFYETGGAFILSRRITILKQVSYNDLMQLQ